MRRDWAVLKIPPDPRYLWHWSTPLRVRTSANVCKIYRPFCARVIGVTLEFAVWPVCLVFACTYVRVMDCKTGHLVHKTDFKVSAAYEIGAEGYYVLHASVRASVRPSVRASDSAISLICSIC